MYCTEVLVTLLGLFGAPQPFGALMMIRRPGNVPLAPRRYAPDYCAQRRASTNRGTQLYGNLRALGGAKFSIRPNFCAILRKNE